MSEEKPIASRADSPYSRWKEIFTRPSTYSYIVVTIFNLIIFLLSIYLVWGYVTLSDIRAKCDKMGADYDQVMESLVSSGPDVTTQTSSNAAHFSVTWHPGSYVAFRRYALRFSSFSYDFVDKGKTNAGVTKDASTNIFAYSPGEVSLSRPTASTEATGYSTFEGGFIEPFVCLTENTLNFLFACGLGYLMSTSLLLVKLTRKQKTSPGLLILRPITGALISGCLFLIVLSGGQVLLKDAIKVNGASIGLIAAFASVYCENFDRWLKERFETKEQ